MRLERREFLPLTAAGLMGAAPVEALRAAGAPKMTLLPSGQASEIRTGLWALNRTNS